MGCRLSRGRVLSPRSELDCTVCALLRVEFNCSQVRPGASICKNSVVILMSSQSEESPFQGRVSAEGQ